MIELPVRKRSSSVTQAFQASLGVATLRAARALRRYAPPSRCASRPIRVTIADAGRICDPASGHRCAMASLAAAAKGVGVATL